MTKSKGGRQAEKSSFEAPLGDYAPNRTREKIKTFLAGTVLNLAVVSPTAAAPIDETPVYERYIDSMTEAPAPRAFKHAILPGPATIECPPVAAGALKLAKRLTVYGEELSQEDQRRRRERLDTSGPWTLNTERTENYQRYKAAADRYDVTVHDVRPYIEVLDEDFIAMHDPKRGKEQALPFAAYLERTNEFLSLYGVEVSILTDPGTDDDLRVPTTSDLESSGAKMHLYSIMKDFAGFPEEFVRQVSGLKKIVLVGSGSEVEGNAATGGDNDTVHLRMSPEPSYSGGTTSVLKHEIYHVIDTAECGNPSAAEKDPTFTAHNAKTAKYTKKIDQWTYQDIRAAKYSYNLPYGNTRTLEGYVEWTCQLKDVLAEANSEVSFFDDYATTSPVEDKADTGSRLMNRDGRVVMTDMRMPPRVTKKYEVLLARLAQANPALAYYFTAIQEQQEPFDNMSALCKIPRNHANLARLVIH